jgi:hypothetical protein
VRFYGVTNDPLVVSDGGGAYSGGGGGVREGGS